jgi:hypothetical protein
MLEQRFGRDTGSLPGRSDWRRVEMLRNEGSEGLIVRRTQLVVAAHDFGRMLARFHIDKVFPIGEEASHLHIVEKLAKQLGG